MDRFFVVAALLVLTASVVGSAALFTHGAFAHAFDETVLASRNATRSVANMLANYQIPEEIRMLFVGDVMLDRGVAFMIGKQNADFRFPFLKTAGMLEEADITIGNLEGPISNRGEKKGSIYSFRMSPDVIRGLVFAGFDVMSIANNHIWDYGREGLEDTITFLNEAGIQPVGAGKNEGEANDVVIMRRGNTTFGFLSFTTLYPEGLEASGEMPGISSANLSEIQRIVKDAALRADILTVLMHWGVEYETKARAAERELGRALIHSGADLVIGGHPHVVQETETYGEGWIAFSLGNFVFDQNFSGETMRGAALEVIAKNGKIETVHMIPVAINTFFQPEFVLP